MEEEFILPLQYKGREMQLPCVFRKLGYTYKISVTVEGRDFLFEPDEEGSFRAAMANIQDERSGVDRALLEAITAQLTYYLK